jgi:hypothetical protein
MKSDKIFLVKKLVRKVDAGHEASHRQGER